jgi:DNA-binding response OmpR family regulator
MKSLPETRIENREDQDTVLLLEHDADLRKIVALMLKECGMHVVEAPNTRIAQQVIQNQTPNLLVLDFEAPSSDSGDLINLFRNTCKNQHKAVLMTTFNRPDDNWRRLFNPDVVIYKPYDVRYLVDCIKRLGF